jgi:hypothetical protein
MKLVSKGIRFFKICANHANFLQNGKRIASQLHAWASSYTVISTSRINFVSQHTFESPQFQKFRKLRALLKG